MPPKKIPRNFDLSSHDPDQPSTSQAHNSIVPSSGPSTDESIAKALNQARRQRAASVAATTALSHSRDFREASVAANQEMRKAFEESTKRLYTLDDKIRDQKFTDTIFLLVDPDYLSSKTYNETGYSKPILFVKGLPFGMKMVPNTTSTEEIMGMLGRSMRTNVIRWKRENVLEILLKENKVNNMQVMTLAELFEHFNATDKKKRGQWQIWNSISNEITNTELGALIVPPPHLTSLDWATYWHDSRKQFSEYEWTDVPKQTNTEIIPFNPCYLKFFLVSTAGSFSDFHADFGGTSVWYHVLTGSKIFWIIEPTERNLEIYKEWNLGSQQEFLGDLVDTCYRYHLAAGTTLILPAGWLHAVYTPEKSLVFGGNFRHIRAASMHIRITELQQEIRSNEEYKYADEALLYYMTYLVQKITGREYIRPTSRKVKLTQSQKDEGFKNIQHGGASFFRKFEKKDTEEGGKAVDAEEDEEYLKYAEEEADVEKLLDGQMPAVEEFVMGEQTFFHPEFMVKKELIEKEGAIKMEILNEQVCREPDCNIDEKILVDLVQPDDIPQWRALIANLRSRQEITLPKGLTRPISLLNCLEALVNKREELERKKTGELTGNDPPSDNLLAGNGNEEIIAEQEEDDVNEDAPPTDAIPPIIIEDDKTKEENLENEANLANKNADDSTGDDFSSNDTADGNENTETSDELDGVDEIIPHAVTDVVPPERKDDKTKKDEILAEQPIVDDQATHSGNGNSHGTSEEREANGVGVIIPPTEIIPPKKVDETKTRKGQEGDGVDPIYLPTGLPSIPSLPIKRKASETTETGTRVKKLKLDASDGSTPQTQTAGHVLIPSTSHIIPPIAVDQTPNPSSSSPPTVKVDAENDSALIPNQGESNGTIQDTLSVTQPSLPLVPVDVRREDQIVDPPASVVLPPPSTVSTASCGVQTEDMTVGFSFWLTKHSYALMSLPYPYAHNYANARAVWMDRVQEERDFWHNHANVLCGPDCHASNKCGCCYKGCEFNRNP